MYSFLLWLTIALLLLWCLTNTTARYRNRRFFKLLFLPCLLLEGGIHLLACALSGVSVKDVAFLEDQKPFVTTTKSRVPVVGMPVWIVIWLGVFYAAFHVSVNASAAVNAYAATLPQLDPAAISEGVVQVDCRTYVDGLRVLYAGTPWNSWELWLLGYFILGSFPFFAVSWKQVQAGLAVIGVVAFLTAGATYMGIGPSLFSRGWYFSYWVLPSHFRVFSLFVTALAATVLLHLGLQGIVRAVQLAAAKLGSGSGQPTRKKRASQPA